MKNLIANSVIIVSVFFLITSPICLIWSHDLSRFIQIAASIVAAVGTVRFENVFHVVSKLDKLPVAWKYICGSVLFIVAVAVNIAVGIRRL